MEFVSLDVVLRAIGACISVPESAKLGADEPVWMQNINESYYRYSEAAALLDHHLVTSQHSPQPRWLDTRDGTGYPRPSDVARNDGMKFLLERAKWYPQWLKFNKEFRMRRLNAIGRWASRPSVEDYFRECPQIPYATHVYEIGFDAENIRDFLNRLAVPHVLTKSESQEASSTPVTSHSTSGVLADAAVNADLHLSSSDETALPVNQVMPGPRVNKTAKPGRRSLINDALEYAYASTGEQRDNVDEVYNQLIKVAKECREKFPRLAGYENGEVQYWVEEKKRPYKKKALSEYISRRRQKEQTQNG